jgi:signal recognition particle GTPase
MSGNANDSAASTSGEERREIVYINGERVVVSYKTDGQKVEIASAYKEAAQQQENEGRVSEQKEGESPRQNADPPKIEVELTPDEKEKLQKKLENKVEQETKEKRAKIYDKEISEELSKGVSPSEKPTLILLAGQGGSGKSKLTEAQEQRFASVGGAA